MRNFPDLEFTDMPFTAGLDVLWRAVEQEAKTQGVCREETRCLPVFFPSLRRETKTSTVSAIGHPWRKTVPWTRFESLV